VSTARRITLDTQIKDIPAQVFFCAHRTVTVVDVPAFLQEVIGALYGETQRLKFEVTGPTVFIYRNSDLFDIEKEFDLEVGIPVRDGKPYSGLFYFKKAQPFRCLTHEYHGSAKRLRRTWRAMVELANESGYQLTNQVREVYKEWESPKSENNVLELQLEISGEVLT
jgi:effector-binding domain-containing protein